MKTISMNCQDCKMKPSSILKDLHGEALEKVSQHKTMKEYPKGALIFNENEKANGLYCVHSGKVKLSSNTSIDGKNTVLSFVNDGDLMGHHHILNNASHSSTATTMENSKVCFLEKDFFLNLIKEESSVAMELVKRLSNEVIQSEHSVTQLTQHSLRSRLADFLLTMSERFGVKKGESIVLELLITREEIASHLGVATESLIRLMSELKDEEVIGQEKRKIIILDKEALLEMKND